jgi:hypothetical protein
LQKNTTAAQVNIIAMLETVGRKGRRRRRK